MAEEKDKKTGSTFRRVYDDTTYFINGIIQEYGVFPTILDTMKDGKTNIELKKRYMLRSIDEQWVNIIEDTLPALDVIIRNPSKYIEEIEEVLPMELTKKVTARSLQHLSQHTNYISKIEGDTIIPSQLLNVFKEETMQTYENKFVNTLINRLFIFVNRRYEIVKKAGQDEKNTSLDMSQEFMHGEVRGNIHFRIEISEDPDESDTPERNYVRTSDLWKRVEKLNSIVSAYASSDFCQKMGKSYIRPPVMHTNAILKNKNLRQCLELWQFIESYENAGYSMLIQEDLEKIDEEYVRQLYSTLAIQYMLFRYNIKNEFEADNTLDSKITDDVLNPHIINELSDIDISEFNETVAERRPPIPSMIRYGTLTPEDKMMLQAVDIALDAYDILSYDGSEKDMKPGDIPEMEAPEIVFYGDGPEETDTSFGEEEYSSDAEEEVPITEETETETETEAEAETETEAETDASDEPKGPEEHAEEEEGQKEEENVPAPPRRHSSGSYGRNRQHSHSSRKKLRRF